MRRNAVVLVALIGALTVGTAAAAGTKPIGGNIKVWVTPGRGAVSKIVITGAIGDYGTAINVTKSGKVDSNGDYVRIKLKQGGFEVNAVALNKKTNNAPPTMVNKTTCSFEFGGTGPVTLFDGTGQYAGISGTIRITQTFAVVGPRYATGAKKGQCNLSNNAAPAAFWGSITGGGPVSF